MCKLNRQLPIDPHSNLQPGSRTRRRHATNHTNSSEATAAFIRRTLCAHHGTAKDRTTPRPIEDLLPPLTSSNEVDLQLYAFIAIIIRDHVSSWYTKITPDHDFIDEVIRIIAHCTRQLEQRLRKVDLEALLLDEIPALVDAHITAYRTAHNPLHPPPLAPDARQAYHTLHPHPALAPVPDPASPETVKQQEENESVYRQLLVQGMLALLLPTEDLENGCLRTLLGDILGEMILGDWIGRSACEGRVWWDGIAKLAETVRERVREPAKETKSPDSTFFPPEITDLTTAWTTQSLSTLLWQILYYAFLIFTILRFTLLTLLTSSSLPTRSSPSSSRATAPSPSKGPILNMRSWTLTSTLLDLPTRMPWLEGLLQLIRHGLVTGPGRSGDTDGLLDRLLAQHISHPLTTIPTAYLPSLLQTLRGTLFPYDRRRPPPPISSSTAPPPAKEASRSRCATSILSLIPSAAKKIYLADTEEDQRRVVERGLDVFGDRYLNKHLVFAVLECLVVRVMPELGVESVAGLLDSRIGIEEEEDESG